MSQAKVEAKILILTTKHASAIRKVIVCVSGRSTMAALLSVGEPGWAFTKPDYEALTEIRARVQRYLQCHLLTAAATPPRMANGLAHVKS